MKHKSHSGAKKRVKKTGTGIFMSEKSCKNHLLVNKSKRQKRLFKKGKPTDKTKQQILVKMLP